ncbi:uncharacterized protein [Paramisgurnus dabryanus]|uniref:uncharacterized protein n=1 Tax=Paramisgurnus dabryanus TaxID=90735 RepID=UPI003CCF970B
MAHTNGFADSTTAEFPHEPSGEQIIDLTIEHGEDVIELSDPLREEEEEEEEGVNGEAAEVLQLYENCPGCSECEPGHSTSQQNGWDRSSWASEHSANGDDAEDWSESQMNAWDQASWSDDNGLPSSGHQTPNSIQPSVDEDNAESLSERVEIPQLFHDFGNRLLAQIEEFKNHFDIRDTELHSRLDTFNRKLHELDNRVQQIYVQLDTHDTAIHTGLDRQRAAIEEIAHDLRHQIQTAEHSFGRLHDLTFEQMRERRLMFEAVYAMVLPIFYP